jgi:CheY-like chemotaxis protein
VNHPHSSVLDLASRNQADVSARFSLVATLAPEMFEPSISVALGPHVLVVGDPDSALAVIDTLASDLQTVIADLGELGERWNGFRLLKHLRARPELAATPVWLMATRWDAGLLNWIIKSGAAGLTKRSLRGIQRALAARPAATLGAPGETANGPQEALQTVVQRERSDTDALLRALGLDPAGWRAADGTLRLAALLGELPACVQERPSYGHANASAPR